MYEPFVVDGRIAFYAERNISEELTVIETGIILSDTSGVDLDNAQYKSVAKSISNTGQFTVRKANPGEKVWYAKAYVIYSDGSECVTLYSDEVSKSI